MADKIKLEDLDNTNPKTNKPKQQTVDAGSQLATVASQAQAAQAESIQKMQDQASKVGRQNAEMFNRLVRINTALQIAAGANDVWENMGDDLANFHQSAGFEVEIPDLAALLSLSASQEQE
jgi:hypothetical protein